MTCPKCGAEMKLDVEMTGGCGGHYGEDDRCYCDSPDVHIDFICPGRRNHRPCRHTIRVIHDKYSLERYFRENYKP